MCDVSCTCIRTWDDFPLVHWICLNGFVRYDSKENFNLSRLRDGASSSMVCIIDDRLDSLLLE